MARQQTTLGRFFSKESDRDVEEVSTGSSKGSSESDVAMSETLEECASASTSTQTETDSIQPSTHGCTCQCCSHPDVPYHPSDLSESKIRHEHHSKDRNMGQKKSYQRKIQSSWFVKYPWISVCASTYRIFCSMCRGARKFGLLSMPHKSAFIDDGFGNWKNALEKFPEHENSEVHRESIAKLAAKNSGQSIASALNRQHDEETKFHREMLLKLLSCIRFLARQGLPLRGHREDTESFEGNLYQLLLLQAQDSPRMKLWLRKKEYLSPEIVNELITMLGHTVLRQILTEIKCSLWFSLIADEASDLSHNEHVSVTIRWTDGNYGIHEDTLGLIQLPNTKAQTIFGVIKDVLIRCSLPISQCRGQAYDGASNMSGIRNGVQALIKREQSKALYVHCLAHSLNLCVQEVTKKCNLIRNTNKVPTVPPLSPFQSVSQTAVAEFVSAPW